MSSNITFTIQPPTSPLPQETAQLLSQRLNDWHWTGSTKSQIVPDEEMNPLKLALTLEAKEITPAWETPSTDESMPPIHWASNLAAYPWPNNPRILALIPHRGCEVWLGRCLTSMIQQSHPPTHIVVIDDASPHPPLELVKAFPQVTLLRSSQQVGPYGLIQAVINQTHYDAYLFQDADDWSSGDRLATLLATARHHGAELVGSQEIRVLEPELQLQAVGYPLNVNQALAQAPGHPLLHPTSLVTRRLVLRLGGFATGLRFGGDTEFLLRAHWVARIVNSSRYCYFRRKRPNSLTTAAATGLDSPARRALTERLKQTARANSNAIAQGQLPNLRPLATQPTVELQHLWGPQLQSETLEDDPGRD